MRKARKRSTIGAVAVTVALSPLAVTSAQSGQRHQAFGGAAASKSVPAGLKYVDEARLPLAKDFVKALRRARPSTRQVTRHTSQLGAMSYRNVTNVTVTKKLGKGEYEYAADFYGPIKAKNVVSMYLSTSPKPYPSDDGSYLFQLGRTKNDGPTSATPMHWLFSVLYVPHFKYVDYVFDSCSVFGGAGGYRDILSESILTLAMRQAGTSLRRAVEGRRVKRPRDVLASEKPPSKCG